VFVRLASAFWGADSISGRKSLFGFLKDGIAIPLERVTLPVKMGRGCSSTAWNGWVKSSVNGGGDPLRDISNSSSDP
jgi:hypothetical protein